MRGKETKARVFRPALWLRLPVIAAFSLWFGITLAALVGGLTLPPQVWLGLALFILLFLSVMLYYWSMRITVDEYAVTYRGLLAFRSYSFDDILEIRVTPVPGMTNYDVRTRFDGLCFTSLISGHKDLVDLIATRANLSARRRRGR
jgi:hypothetical protein